MNKLRLFDNNHNNKKIGFIGGGFKPFTKGHYYIIQKAAQDNDLVHLYIGMGDRTRPGELPITWDSMKKVWDKYLLNIMPSNVVVKYATNPVGAIYEQMTKYDEMSDNNLDLYVYGDQKDLAAYYTEKKLSKYVPNLYSQGKVHMLGFDRSKGVNISGTELRRRIASGDARGFMEGLPEPLQNPKIATAIIKLLVPNPLVIKEGGLAGHMSHMHEDLDLTFGEIKDIFDIASQGKLENVTEKLDGQNVFFTYNVTARQLRFARNKGDIKNGGMNIEAIANKWKDKPTVANSFMHAYKVLNASISTMPNKIAMFGRAGNIWYSCEIIYKENVNVIDYGINAIVIHESGTAYDANGNPINVDTSANYNALISSVDSIQEQGKTNMQGWEVKKPVVVSLARMLDNKPQKEAIQKINNIQTQYGLNDQSTIGDLAAIMYANSILKPILMNELNDQDLLIDIAKIILEPSYNVAKKKSELVDIGLSKEQISAIGKNMSADLGKHIKAATSAVEHIIHDFATQLLQGVNSALILNPTKETQRLQAETQQAIQSLKTMPDEKVKQFLAIQLPKLQDINQITAIEGIVFKYNDKIYKLTGAFAPVNQFLGAFKYGL